MGNLCSCCYDKHDQESCDFVMDQLCYGWSVPEGTSQDIYVATGVAVVGSGYLAYDEGDFAFVTFRFFNGASQVVKLPFPDY
ncbi:S-Ena type endospore appendage [Gracilibacillus oryzae]|uniref:S-Ena type endospore appendage n=1 Tax=Gracilibacillus oryzae TaxID=1672701 RepID=UPI003898FCF6